MRKLTDSEIKNLVDVIHKGLNLCGTSIDYDALNILMTELFKLREQISIAEKIVNWINEDFTLNSEGLNPNSELGQLIQQWEKMKP